MRRNQRALHQRRQACIQIRQPDGRASCPGCGSLVEVIIDTVHINKRSSMETVTISPDFQIEIPRSIRDAMGLRPGQQVHVFAYENSIQIIPVRRPADMRGFLAGMSTAFPRDADRI